MKIAGQQPFYVIAGLGKTGVSVARFLNARGLPFAVTDTRENPPGFDEIKQIAPTVAASFGALDADMMTRADVVVLSPGLSIHEPAVEKARAQGIKIIGDIELFVQYARAPIIAITGSNGKSTTTALTTHLLNCAGKTALMGGNIGVPALDLLMQAVPDVYVLELSSFQLETTHSLHAAAATVLNISEDHIDRHGSLSAYAEAKARIYHRAKLAVLNGDDQETWREAKQAEKRTQFSLHNARAPYRMETIDGKHWLVVNDHPLMLAEQLPIAGEHNVANALAAIALCEAVGVPARSVRDGLLSFVGLPHRCVRICDKHGVTYYNDSKATNVGAALAAIAGLGPMIAGKLVLIAGGDAKGQALSPLTPALEKYVRAVVLIGRDAEHVRAIVPDTVVAQHSSSIEEAVTQCAALAQPGDAVLLSPACASLDMFKNYEERGDRFAQAAERLP